jgi:integrase
MPRLEKRLSAVGLKHLGPGVHADGLNLYLQVTPAGNRSWLFRYMLDGKARAAGLGPLHTVSLAEARIKAQGMRKLLLDGTDPLAEKQQLRSKARLDAARAVTFKAAAESYIEAHRAGWRNHKSADQWAASLEKYANPIIGALPVAVIDTALMMRVLQPIWTNKTETATRVRGRCEVILDWATVRGYRVGPNPATWRGRLDKLLPKRSKIAPVRHHPAIPYVEIASFMTELRCHDGLSTQALQFTILTAARTGEVIGAQWPEFDLKRGIWMIPGDRMKAGRVHRSVLSRAAIALLKQIPRIDGSTYLFPGIRPGQHLSNAAMHELLKEMRPGLTVHGFRSTFMDWAAAETNHAREVASAALAHVLGDKTEAAYLRGDMLEKRRALMEDWARYCCGGRRR